MTLFAWHLYYNVMGTSEKDSFSHCPLVRFLVIIGLFLLFFSSCTPQKESQVLLCADSLMVAYPDSALTLLENVSSPQKLSRADRALYALLLTQARHKNYIALDDDSLIKTAIDYYGDTKKSLRAAQAYYYWGTTYKDKGNSFFAVEQYLKAIQLMPDENAFLAMIYDNLAECYEEEDLYDVARESYQKSYQILYRDKNVYYPLRGIAHIFLLQNQLDSALCYFHKAFEGLSITQDSGRISVLYNDFATVYLEKKQYIQANEYASKVIMMPNSKDLNGAYHLKGWAMLNLNQIDSARYYFNKINGEQGIYRRATCCNGLCQVEKKAGNWEAAVRYSDAYKVLYDSIQGLSKSEELDKLMDNHQLERYKRELSDRQQIIIGALFVSFLFLTLTVSLLFVWNDARRKKRYIVLQQELVQKRVDAMILINEGVTESEEEHNNRMTELREQQLMLCISIFETTEGYKKLQTMEKATVKQLRTMRTLKLEINMTIRKIFIDVMANLRECYPSLTYDDLFYCVLSLLRCSRTVVIELMDASSDALKTRKSRIKSKMDPNLFEYIFMSDNQ